MSGRTGRTTPPALPGVHVPTSLSEALQILRREPNLPIWAGATWWMDKGLSASSLLSLQALPELKRVVRSDLRVDIGAAVPVARLREAGHRYLPELLMTTLDRQGPPPVRNMATLGGAISLPEGILPVSLVLQLLDARVELRRAGSSRWSAINAMHRIPGEILTRIRIPLKHRTHWMLHQFGNAYPLTSPSMTVAATARVDKNGLAGLHCGLLIRGTHLIRLREAEAELVGRQLPLTERDQRILLSALREQASYIREMDDLGRWRAISTLKQFLRRLG
ncbi:CO or xanthine dehydrogenase, FAD-binding subunit [Alkalispirochaeta americana]|uniref:CO or xanthine dehydrogenase, FAD-binding subunit n=1 Tax=Alkalispirochaeta americana TaxID=159291 RepID=A0A1N6WHV4_9SPIO|nr:FAD binding domain-containing protein [Alkalispirochaeta americana]SIQ89546.1 CO or xanthine dehydrogenase, FAD-binding subunit [Alkalispirochaeta americana]